jgi:pimeloyl-ACP methyl ester carboxylesterase
MPTKEIIINNLKVEYLENINENSTEPIFVFLHGWGVDLKTFSLIYGEVKNYLAFDFPGSGNSSQPKKAWNLTNYAEITHQLLTYKILENPELNSRQIIFVAHSFGGRVLVKLLNQYKLVNVKQIICIGVPFVREFTLKQKSIQAITKSFKIILKIFPKNIAKKVRKKWYRIIGANDYIELENEIMKKTFQNIISEDISELALILKNYQTIFIWGENDKEAPLIHAESIAKKVKADLKIIKNSGHFPFIEKKDEFRKIFKRII